MRRITTVEHLRSEVRVARLRGDRVALVPTMGALHAGHLALVELAAARADTVVVSIFVNPTQFDRPDDLVAYPRDLDGDEQALRELGGATPALVFAPEVGELYPSKPLTTVHVSELTDGLCGAGRPGHFDGVATVVTKLLNIVAPDVAVFGRKDAQQLRVVRRLVADLDLAVEVVDGPTVREADGLALSSRNRRLGPQDRAVSRAIPTALRAAVAAATDARTSGRPVTTDEVRHAAERVLHGASGLELEYLALVDPTTLRPLTGAVDRLLVALAAHVGSVRLIDNVEVGHLEDERRLLDAVPAPATPTDPEA